jgi:hypothetical protein
LARNNKSRHRPNATKKRRNRSSPARAILPIIQGYKDFGLPLDALDFAVRQAVEDKKLTPI